MAGRRSGRMAKEPRPTGLAVPRFTSSVVLLDIDRRTGKPDTKIKLPPLINVGPLYELLPPRG